MQTLNARDYNSFKTLARMDQQKLHNTVFNMLKNIYPKDKVKRNPYGVWAEGTIPICLIAHLDTVFTYPPEEFYYDREANVIWSPDGLGADDRAGVFSIFKIISEGLRPHIVFTTDEEIGAIGASNLSQMPCPFKDLKYIIELDRANAIDCVFYDGANYEFQTYVESFGFVTAIGSFTDIVELCPAWGISGVNLSIGYKNEHTSCEQLFVGQMFSTIDKVKKMLLNPPTQKFQYIGLYEGYYHCRCHECGKLGSSYLMIPVVCDEHGHRIWLCSDCATNKNIEWCERCYEGYVPGLLNEEKLCPSCQKIYSKSKRMDHEYTKTIS